MRKFKELMRLKFEAGLTMGAGTVSRYVHHLQAVGLSWPLPAQLSDADIERRHVACRVVLQHNQPR